MLTCKVRKLQLFFCSHILHTANQFHRISHGQPFLPPHRPQRRHRFGTKHHLQGGHGDQRSSVNHHQRHFRRRDRCGSGVMRGSVKAAKLIVAGTVEPLNDADLIEATEYLAIAKDGFLTSNEVVYGKIAMEMGAVVQAGMRPMGPRQVKAALHEGAAIKAPAPSAATPSGSILHFERERASATQIPAFLTPTHAVVSDDQTTVGSEHSEPRTGTHDNVLTPLGS